MKHHSFRRVPRVRSLLAIATLALAAPATASADIPITSFKAGPVAPFNLISGLPVTQAAPTDPSQNDVGCMHINPGAPVLSTQAGATTDYCINIQVDASAVKGEDIKNTLIGLPVGSEASIDNATKCSDADFAQASIAVNTCPGASQVGTVLAKIEVPTGPGTFTTQESPGRVYALETPADKAAKFGVALVAQGGGLLPYSFIESKSTITVSQLGDPSIGLQNQSSDLTKVTVNPAAPTTPVPITIQALSLRFWGSAAAHPHLTNPFVAPTAPVTMASDFFLVGTTCATPQTATLQVNPYTDSAGTASSQPTKSTTTYNLTGCDSLGFKPTFTAGISGETGPSGHPQLDIHITNPAGNEDLGATSITLPYGIASDITRIQNPCSVDQFNSSTCPDSTIIGSVKATLTGINADVVSGAVYQVKNASSPLPSIGLAFKGRLPLRLLGTTTIDSSKRIVNTFANLPSIPERSLDITLNGGATGILQLAPAGTACVRSAYNAVLTGQNGKTSSTAIPTGCPAQFTARLARATTTKSPYLTLYGTGATDKRIQALNVVVPKGLTINKNKSQSGVKVDKFDAGTTGTASRSRVSASQLFVGIPKPGSNSLKILTKGGFLTATKAFAKSTTASTVQVGVVYMDGSRETVTVALSRK